MLAKHLPAQITPFSRLFLFLWFAAIFLTTATFLTTGARLYTAQHLRWIDTVHTNTEVRLGGEHQNGLALEVSTCRQIPALSKAAVLRRQANAWNWSIFCSLPKRT